MDVVIPPLCNARASPALRWGKEQGRELTLRNLDCQQKTLVGI